jgi:hypothetical protein
LLHRIELEEKVDRQPVGKPVDESKKYAYKDRPGIWYLFGSMKLRIFLADNDRLLHSAIPEGYDSIKPTFKHGTRSIRRLSCRFNSLKEDID